MCFIVGLLHANRARTSPSPFAFLANFERKKRVLFHDSITRRFHTSSQLSGGTNRWHLIGPYEDLALLARMGECVAIKSGFAHWLVECDGEDSRDGMMSYSSHYGTIYVVAVYFLKDAYDTME